MCLKSEEVVLYLHDLTLVDGILEELQTTGLKRPKRNTQLSMQLSMGILFMLTGEFSEVNFRFIVFFSWSFSTS